MATVQKVRAKGSITKTAIDQKQSLDVVQTLLHGALSTVAYYREFFSEKSFFKQFYEMGDNIPSYDDFAAGKLHGKASERGNPGTTIPSFRAGRSKRVDTFLAWLDGGVFPAVKAGDLAALQLAVHPDRSHRDLVLETYTFTVKYDRKPGQARVPSGVQVDASGTDRITVEATILNFQIVLRQVQDLCKVLPNLPKERYVSLSLFYDEGVVKSQQPPGFHPGSDNALYFPEVEGWARQTKPLKDLPSGFHSTSLKVSHMQKSTAGKHASNVLPYTADFIVGGSRYSDIDTGDDTSEVVTATPDAVAGAEPGKSTALARVQDQRDAQREPAATSSSRTGMSEKVNEAQARPASALGPHKRSAFSEHFAEGTDTQTSNIPEMKSRLKSMMQPETTTQGDTQLFDPSVALERTSTGEPLSSPDRAATDGETTTSPVQASAPKLQPEVLHRLKTQSAAIRKSVNRLAKKAGSQRKSGELILCQCGYAKTEGHMIQCFCCGTWQHAHCYGYLAKDDPRLPNEHVCSTCVLDKGDSSTFEALQQLANLRRGMVFIQQHGLKAKGEFSRDIGLEPQIADKIYKEIQKRKYVRPSSNSHKAGFKAKGLPLHVPVTEGPAYQKMLEDLFDPMTHLENYYEAPSESNKAANSLAQRLFAANCGKMPLAATPIAEKLKKSAATPSSVLDLPESMTPFETPSRPAGPETRGSKRPAEEPELPTDRLKRINTPAQSVHRFKYLESELFIDACGKSSPVVQDTPAGK